MGCSSHGSVHANDNSALAQQRREWQLELEQRLKKIDREMDELTSKALKDPGVAKMKAQNHYYDRMAELEKQRTDTRQKYESLRKTTNEKWQQMKLDVEKAADSMEKEWRKFLDEMRS